MAPARQELGANSFDQAHLNLPRRNRLTRVSLFLCGQRQGGLLRASSAMGNKERFVTALKKRVIGKTGQSDGTWYADLAEAESSKTRRLAVWTGKLVPTRGRTLMHYD